MNRKIANHSQMLRAIIYLHFAFPFAYILVLSVLYNFPIGKTLQVFFSVYFIGRSIFAIWLGWMLFKSRPWAWHLFVFNSILILVEQIYVAVYLAENNNPFASVFLTATSVFIGLILVRFEFRVPYFSPRIPWWESDPRYKISVPVQIYCAEVVVEAEILDISSSGCFVKTKAMLPSDEPVRLRFSLFENEFECSGDIVWHAESALTHPQGIGIRFQKMPKSDYLRLRKTTKKLLNLSQKLKRARSEEKVSRFEAKINARTDEK